MVRAVLLIKAPAALTAAQVKQVEGVKDAFDVTGRFDCVALIEVRDAAALKRTILKIQRIKRVSRTETMVELP